jgi:hypothetical protein
MNAWRAIYGLNVPAPSAFMPTWFEILSFYCLIEESDALYYSPPVNSPLQENDTFLYI